MDDMQARTPSPWSKKSSFEDDAESILGGMHLAGHGDLLQCLNSSPNQYVEVHVKSQALDIPATDRGDSSEPSNVGGENLFGRVPSTRHKVQLKSAVLDIPGMAGRTSSETPSDGSESPFARVPSFKANLKFKSQVLDIPGMEKGVSGESANEGGENPMGRVPSFRTNVRLKSQVLDIPGMDRGVAGESAKEGGESPFGRIPSSKNTVHVKSQVLGIPGKDRGVPNESSNEGGESPFGRVPSSRNAIHVKSHVLGIPGIDERISNESANGGGDSPFGRVPSFRAKAMDAKKTTKLHQADSGMTHDASEFTSEVKEASFERVPSFRTKAKATTKPPQLHAADGVKTQASSALASDGGNKQMATVLSLNNSAASNVIMTKLHNQDALQRQDSYGSSYDEGQQRVARAPGFKPKTKGKTKTPKLQHAAGLKHPDLPGLASENGAPTSTRALGFKPQAKDTSSTVKFQHVDGIKIQQDISRLRSELNGLIGNDWEAWQAFLSSTARCCDRVSTINHMGLTNTSLAEDAFELVRGCIEKGPLSWLLDDSGLVKQVYSKSHHHLQLAGSGNRAAKAMLDFLTKLQMVRDVWTSEQVTELRQWRTKARHVTRTHLEGGNDEDATMTTFGLPTQSSYSTQSPCATYSLRLAKRDQPRQLDPLTLTGYLSVRRGMSGWICPRTDSSIRPLEGFQPPCFSKLHKSAEGLGMSVQSTPQVLDERHAGKLFLPPLQEAAASLDNEVAWL